MEEKRKRYEPRGKKRSPLPIVILAIIVLFGAGGGLFLFGSREEAPRTDLPTPEAGRTGPGESVEDPPSGEPAPRRPAVAGPPLAWVTVSGPPADVRAKLELPLSTTAKTPEDVDRVVEVGVEADGTLWITGKRVNLATLREQLFMNAEPSRDLRHPSRPSNVLALIAADGGVRWREIQWVMQACADPAVRIWRICWAVATPNGEGTLPVPLPKDRGLSRHMTPGKETPKITVELKRTRHEDCTRVEIMGRAIGIDAFDDLASILEGIIERNPGISAEVHAWAWVPFHQVVQTVDQIRGVGIETITFIGAPPSEGPRPSDPVEEAK